MAVAAVAGRAAMNAIEAGPLLIAAGAAFAAVLAILGSASLVQAPRSRVLDRVVALEQRTPYVRDVTLLRDRTTSDIRLLDVLLRGRAWAVKTAMTLDRADIRLRVGEYACIRVTVVAIGMLAGVVLVSALGLPAVLGAIAGGITGFFLPILFVRQRISRKRKRVEGQLIELCDLMASMLRSGFGYLQAITSTADQIGAPLSVELRRVIDGVRLGVDVDEAFEAMNDRLDSKDFTVLMTAMNIQRRSGGNLAEILDSVAETIRDRQALRQEIAALTAMEQATSVFAAGFPIVLITILMILAPVPFRLLLTDTIGRFILCGALLLDAVGFLVMRRVTRLEA
jgi:tight adherence protein B